MTRWLVVYVAIGCAVVAWLWCVLRKMKVHG